MRARKRAGPSARTRVAWKCPPLFPNHIGGRGYGGAQTWRVQFRVLGQRRPPASWGRARHCPVAGPAWSPVPSRQQDHQHHPHCPVHPSSFSTSWQRVRSQGQWGSCPLPVTPQPLLPPPAPATAAPRRGPREGAAATGFLSPAPGPAPATSGSLGPCQVSSPLALSPEHSPARQAPDLAACPSPPPPPPLCRSHLEPGRLPCP